MTANHTSGLGYTSALPPTNDDPRQGYTGYQKDDESGLDFAQARYYNSAHGRFTSVDPLTASASIRNPQTFNRYSYVLNSPYKFSDPLGLLPMGTRSSDGGCTAENSSCADKYDPWEGREEVPEATPPDEGVAANHETLHSADDSQQQAEEPEPPPPPQEDDRQKMVADASAPTDTVNLETGGQTETNVEIKLKKSITETLENDAIALNNLRDLKGNQYDGVIKALSDLAETGSGYTLDSKGGKLILITSEMTKNLGVSIDIIVGGVTTASNNNVMSLIQSHNDTVDKISQKYTDGKTAFQTDPRFKNSLTSRVGSTKLNVRLQSGYLGKLYARRLGSLALQ